jgi:hypothetical protein
MDFVALFRQETLRDSDKIGRRQANHCRFVVWSDEFEFHTVK